MDQRHETLIRLLHLADSALPIGSAAHSYGMETLVFHGDLVVDRLDGFFTAYIEESGVVEANFCARAYDEGVKLVESDGEHDWNDWERLNRRLSARKPAKESRSASTTLGRRLLRLALSLSFDARLYAALGESSPNRSPIDIHHATAFGLLGGWWQLGRDETVLAFMQQMVTGLISACQRLMPLGQNRAQSILWSLQPILADTAARANTIDHDQTTPSADLTVDWPSFSPLLELGSMRHPALPTRLFIS